MKDQATALARELNVVGLMNVQFAIQGKTIYVLEVNPRALAHGAVHLQGHRRGAGEDRGALHGGQDARGAGPHRRELEFKHVAVKESVFPFARFAGRRRDPRAGDEVHRRGDGPRRRLPLGLRQERSSRRA